LFDSLCYFKSNLIYYERNRREGSNQYLNTKWKETQFDTVTRLKNEVAPVDEDEACFTPGTPFAAKVSASIFFGRGISKRSEIGWPNPLWQYL